MFQVDQVKKSIKTIKFRDHVHAIFYNMFRIAFGMLRPIDKNSVEMWACQENFF